MDLRTLMLKPIDFHIKVKTFSIKEENDDNAIHNISVHYLKED